MLSVFHLVQCFKANFTLSADKICKSLSTDIFTILINFFLHYFFICININAGLIQTLSTSLVSQSYKRPDKYIEIHNTT